MSVERKVKVAVLSIVSNTGLIILKVIAGILSGSVSIISEAIHSSMDLLASVIAFFAVKFSSKPADKDHPYGHGKLENISGVVEGLLIFIAAFLIIKEAVHKLTVPTEIKETWVAVSVMLISAIVNYLVSKKLYKVAKEEDSMALEADALHLKTDIYTSLGVGVGLLLISFTHLPILDPIVAILVALLIIKEAWALCSNAIKPLLDGNLSDDEIKIVENVLLNYENEILNFHCLRSRKAGNMRFVDFHITVNGEMTVTHSHELTERIENDIENEIKHANVHIHIEPHTHIEMKYKY